MDASLRVLRSHVISTFPPRPVLPVLGTSICNINTYKRKNSQEHSLPRDPLFMSVVLRRCTFLRLQEVGGRKMKCKYGAVAEWNCQKKTEKFAQKPMSQDYFLYHIHCDWDGKRASMVRGPPLMAWVMAQTSESHINNI